MFSACSDAERNKYLPQRRPQHFLSGRQNEKAELPQEESTLLNPVHRHRKLHSNHTIMIAKFKTLVTSNE